MDVNAVAMIMNSVRCCTFCNTFPRLTPQETDAVSRVVERIITMQEGHTSFKHEKSVCHAATAPAKYYVDTW